LNNLLYTDESKAVYFDHRQPDPDLTAIGVEQTKILAEYLAQPYSEVEFDRQNRHGFGLTHLYTSLMLRAVKTGYAISQTTGIPLVAMPEIHETGGVFDVKEIDGETVFIGQPGLGRSDLESAFPEMILPESVTDQGWYKQGIEPEENYNVRAKQVIELIIEKHGETTDRVGFVLHGGIFARMMKALLDVRNEKSWFSMNNCAISRLDINVGGRVKLTYLNRVNHLPDHLVT
jgi:2,3-bisphosphoglycerate-dependent phosphoglycerate mutase